MVAASSTAIEQARSVIRDRFMTAERLPLPEERRSGLIAVIDEVLLAAASEGPNATSAQLVRGLDRIATANEIGAMDFLGVIGDQVMQAAIMAVIVVAVAVRRGDDLVLPVHTMAV